MLRGLLSREECAKCRICCSFDSYDLWETPVITTELSERILQAKPEQRFITKDDHFLLRLEREPDRDLYYCSLLDHSRGCILGDEKPFDCRIWPFRVMELDGLRVITVSPVCPVVSKKPLEDIRAKCAELAPVIFAEAKKHPGIIKQYLEGYPILAVEK